MGPVVKLQHRLRSPATHAGQIGSTPRVTHVSHGLRTTRWPTSTPSTPSASGPRASTRPTTSCPRTCGNEHRPLSALSVSPSKSRSTCLASDPQMPVSVGRTTTQSGRSGVASGISRRAQGVDARFWASRVAPAGGVHGSGVVP